MRPSLEQRPVGSGWTKVVDAPMPTHASDGVGSGAGAGAVPLSVVLGGLEPYTAYSYRLVAHNESVGASMGPLLTSPTRLYTSLHLLTPP